MFFRNKVLAAKVESVYATDPTPTGTDAVLTSNMQIQPYNGPTVSRNLDRAIFGAQQVINTNPQVQISFDVEIAGSGSAGTAPAYSDILRACGMSVADSSPTGVSKIYSLISTSVPSLTFWFYHDNMKHVINGARGNMSMSFTRGEIPRYSFTFIGRYTRPTTATPLTGVTTDYIAPVPVTRTNTPSLLVGGSPLYSLKTESFTLDMGNNLVARNVIGSEEIMITDRNVTGTIVCEATDPTTKNWWSGGIENHSGITLLSAALTHGTTSGNIVRLNSPAVQLTSVAQQDSDGLIVHSFGTSFTPVSGNDEFVLTVY